MISPGDVIRWSAATAAAGGTVAFLAALAGVSLRRPRRALRAASVPDRTPRRICAVIEAGSLRPCVLADGHDWNGDREHATAWVDDKDPKCELRHRWDANDVLGREERRYRTEFLPKFTNDGDRAGM